jgi:arylsulfatase A-like enzyme
LYAAGRAVGHSLTPLWGGAGEGYGRDVAIAERWRDTSHMIAVRTAQFKYIWDDARPEEPELYHLPVDPGEKENVRADHPDVIAELHTHVEAQLARMQETRPLERDGGCGPG